MSLPYAEVIGDPIAQSKSPAIHKSWLETLGLEGDYRATQVPADGLDSYFAARRRDPEWRGCNVTIPHKQAVVRHLDRLDSGAEAIGAVNCIVPAPEGLGGFNTDIDGVAAALEGVAIEGAKVAMIGAGGGARAALRYLLDARAGYLTIVVRNPARAEEFARQGPIEIHHLDGADAALAGATVILNASSMGMAGADRMPPALLAAVERHARGATLFDMVYKPLETPFLAAGRAGGGRPVDGLTMLVGQAKAAFRLFFGQAAPAGDAGLRGLAST